MLNALILIIHVVEKETQYFPGLKLKLINTLWVSPFLSVQVTTDFGVLNESESQ